MNTHNHGLYRLEDGHYVEVSLKEIVSTALLALEKEVIGGTYLNSPQSAKDYITLKLGALEHEVFAVLFLDAQVKIISYQEMFRGTLTQTSVYPREVVKECLKQNANAVMLIHNHPSGLNNPSRADEMLTSTLKSALNLVDVRVLDHFIVSKSGCLSFAERGLL